ncbi:MAG: hypothetical protein JWM33_836, partial [Caulobacteraceae bacterium]|nr:hypothetical protein [Caulobacteraceae bacterium]
MRSAGLRRLAAGLTGISILVASPGWTQARLVGERPAANSEEAGLWAISDKAEAAARTKADLDRDATLTAYVRQVACKVASAHCGEVRVYVMDRPF